MKRNMIVGALIAATLGCQGELGVGPEDVGPATDVGSDVALVPDQGASGDAEAAPDLGQPMPDPLCVGVTCTPGSSCYGGQCYCDPGFMGDPTVGCTAGNPCEGVTCPFGATCRDDGMCACDSGFDADSLGGCVFEEPSFPDERTQMEVCQRWNADYPPTAVMKWQTRPTEECEPGILDPDYVLDAVRRVTLLRWLVGLPAVTTHVDYARQTQACATALAAEGIGVRPMIASNFKCHSGDAEDGALNSNITRGPKSPADAVDWFMIDEGVPSLGHRRWILNPEMGRTAFGIRGEYSCMHAVDVSGSANPLWVAYPFGTFPEEALLGPWTFASDRLLLENATVTITDAAGGNVATTDFAQPDGNFGLPTIAWSVPGAVAGGVYTVTISGLTGSETEVTYPVSIVNCE